MTKSGTGTWTLSGSNTYTGLTTVSAGTLKAGATLPFVGALTISGGIYDANDFATTVTGLTTVSSGSYLAKSSTQTLNGGLTVSGGTFTGLTGAVDINGNVSLTSGILTATSGAFTVSGNWAGGGTFTPGTGTIVFDGTNQSISNNNTFYGLTKTVSSADTFTLPASCTQTITNLIWQGTSSNKLSVVSSSGSVNATVAVSGTVTADNLIITLITASPGQTATNSSGTSATGWDFGTTPAAATVATTLNTGPVQDAISSSSVVTVGTLTTTSTTPSATVASSSAVALSNFGNAKATFWAPAPVGNGGFLLGTKSMEVKVGVLEGLVYVRMKKDNSLANVFGGEQLSVAKGQFKPSYQAVVANCATEVSKESPSVDQMTMRTGNLEKLSNSTVKFGQTVVPAGEQRITVENRGSVKISSIGNNLSDRVFSSRSLERILGDSQPLVAVSPNNNIAIVSDSGLVLFNQNTGSVKTVEMNGLPTAVTATRNGGAVITSNVDRTTQYVNANGMAKTLRLAVVPTKVVDVDGQRCVFTDGNNTVGIINYAKGTVGTKIHVENPRDIVMNPSDSNQVYVSQGNGIIQVFDLSNNRQIKMVKTIDTGVSNMGPMAIASNGSITVASRVNSLCKIIQPNGKMSEFSTPGPVTSLGFMGPDLHSITPVGIAGVISGAPKQAQPLVATKELASAPAQFASAGITKPVSMITPMPEQIFGGAMPVVKESIVPLQTSALVAPKASIATTQPTLKVEDIRVLPTPLPSDETIALVAPKASIATTQPTLKVEDIRVLPTPLPSDETIALVAP
ncbi:MAG: autotransporter-associated beta strand repeat-containing protein, partial [Candidatus Kerfeldbacteria bacterium]|nr:autotransporter-associated beta strand repeat-containing protein [Candidatus Kerfeldbacteria bacterium]